MKRTWLRNVLGLAVLAVPCSPLAGCGADDPAASIGGSGSPDAGSAPDAAQIYFDAGTVISDAGTVSYDAGGSDGGGSGGGCQLGGAGSFATDTELNLFGDIIYFAKGQVLPQGRYRVRYADGCMKFNAAFQWTVNASASDGWWLVGATQNDKVALLPGTFPPIAFLGGYADFEECVAANKALPPGEFDFAGGKLGIWLNDAPYQDNQAGAGGRNPKWSLELLVDVCPPDIVLN